MREAVGDDIVLMLDPFGVYTLEESLWVARELEELNYYWLEHPMVETRVESYRRLTEQTSIAICSPRTRQGRSLCEGRVAVARGLRHAAH